MTRAGIEEMFAGLLDCYAVGLRELLKRRRATGLAQRRDLAGQTALMGVRVGLQVQAGALHCKAVILGKTGQGWGLCATLRCHSKERESDCSHLMPSLARRISPAQL
jgi:hypothetical protein